MKYLVFSILFLFSLSFHAQQTTVVNGNTYELTMEIEGELDLLWNVIDKRFHYFVRTKDETIIELLNTQ
jgi:NAD/NADP transhydrogenase beta subunit